MSRVWFTKAFSFVGFVAVAVALGVAIGKTSAQQVQAQSVKPVPEYRILKGKMDTGGAIHARGIKVEENMKMLAEAAAEGFDLVAVLSVEDRNTTHNFYWILKR